MASSTFRDRPYQPDEKTRRLIRKSRSALLLERGARALWPAFTVLCFVLAAALMGLYATLTPVWHGWIVGGSALAVLAAAAIGLARLRWPSVADAEERLDGSMPEAKPLAVLTDTQAAGREDMFARAVWLEHQRRAERAARKLVAIPADLKLARFDAWALRLFAPALLIGGIIAAGGNWQARLASLVEPVAPPAAAGTVIERVPLAEAWVVPPVYTGLDTVYLDRETASYTLPQGAQLTLRATDVDTLPGLEAPGVESEYGFQELGAGLWELRGSFASSGRLGVTNGIEPLAGWDITVTPDAVPEIEMDGAPRPTMAGATEFAFTAKDD
ncbi:MAG: DUF4175 family protein, partial [Pseudomonadota bacterium]